MSMFTSSQLYGPQGKPLTKSLFTDFGVRTENILSLNTSSKGQPCLKSLYVSLTVEDPSEHTFVDVVFGDFQFWKKLSSVSWMKENLKEWRHEADVQRKSKAWKVIIDEVQSDGRNAYHAAKYIIEEPWKGKAKPVREAAKKSAAEALPDNVQDLKEYLSTKP